MLSDDFKDWVLGVIGGYWTPVLGQWLDDGKSASKKYIIINYDGGGVPLLDVKTQRFRVWLMGAEKGGHAEPEAAATQLEEASIGANAPCRTANVVSLTGKIGPGLTAEGRSYFQINLEVMH